MLPSQHGGSQLYLRLLCFLPCTFSHIHPHFIHGHDWLDVNGGVCLNGRAAMGLRALIVSLLRQKLLAWLLFDSSTVLHGRFGRSRVLGRCHVGGRGAQPLFFFFFFKNHFCHVASGNACFFSGWQVFFYGNETAVRRVVSFLMLPTTKSQSFAMDVRNGWLKMAFLGLHTHFLPLLLKKTHHLIVLTSFIYVCIYFKFVGMGCRTSAANGLGKQNAPCVRHLLWLLI